ncbi:Hypothetical protein NTJ_07787 [Nesidiocoris tenuis]|uniref:Secreted protein n=1 Tax=Nesidiocoris tenuis TaxID=355587 RepID=A0ABN7ARZ4_9HEMI|nr:Hypothetical protein NTJ_07787 [Nesidiocoris tenuis]
MLYRVHDRFILPWLSLVPSRLHLDVPFGWLSSAAESGNSLENSKLFYIDVPSVFIHPPSAPRPLGAKRLTR